MIKMRATRRIAALLSAFALLMSVSSCSLAGSSENGEKLEGQEIIEASMSRYNDQNSGGYMAYDNLTDKLTERFMYCYDEVGFLTYLSEIYEEDGSVYKEYNTGYVIYIEEDGVGQKLSKNDERFVVYNKEISRYNKTTDAVFGYIVSGVEKVDVSENADGTKQYTYIYDPDKAGIAIDGGSMDEYAIAYNVNAQGDVYSLRQTASGVYDSGETFEYDYTIELLDSDSVGLIENPIVVTEK